MRKKIMTRRDFLRGAAGTALAAALGPGIPQKAQAQPTAKVVLIRNSDVLARPDKMQGVLEFMLDDAVKTLLGTSDSLAAWRKLIRSSDVVGVKSNEWARLPTPKPLEEAIKGRLLDLGIQQENISIADRGVLENPFFRNATALINVRPLRTHHWAGVGSCLKNYIQFVSDRPSYHPDACAALGSIWTLPLVKGKTRLNVQCALTPQFYGRGANFFDTRYVWPYRGLIVGTDPVAVDAVAAHLLQVKRIAFFGEDRTLDVPPSHIIVADKKYSLGVSDLKRIELIKLGWMEEVLI
jgi:hypothetical protein